MLIFLDPPSNIVAYNTSSSSINVTWYPIFSGNLPDDNFTGYRVSYREYSLDQEVNFVLCSSANFYTTELTSLNVFSNYCIDIALFTERKVSNTSQCLFITTDEAGKTNINPCWMFTRINCRYGVCGDRLHNHFTIRPNRNLNVVSKSVKIKLMSDIGKTMKSVKFYRRFCSIF